MEEVADPIRRIVRGSSTQRSALADTMYRAPASLYRLPPRLRQHIGEIEFSRHLKFRALLNLTKGYRDEWISGWDLMEVDMAALFSVAVNVIFFGFVIAVALGHVLVIEALLRPFFGKRAATDKPVLRQSSLSPRPVH